MIGIVKRRTFMRLLAVALATSPFALLEMFRKLLVKRNVGFNYIKTRMGWNE